MIKKITTPIEIFVEETLCTTRHQRLEDIINLGFDKMNIRLDGADKALELKAKDLENRLHALNELRAEVLRDRMMFLTKETYDIKTTGYDAWCAGIDKKIVAIETKILTWTAALGVFFVLLQLFLHYFTNGINKAQ